MKKLLHVKENSLHVTSSELTSKDPSKGLQKSYAQVVKEGKRSSLESLHVDDVFELHSPESVIKAKVLEKK